MRNVHSNIMRVLRDFNKIMEGNKIEIFNFLNPRLKVARSLLGVLEIGTLNSIGAFRDTIQEEFDALEKLFPQMLHELLDFKGIVEGDFK